MYRSLEIWNFLKAANFNTITGSQHSELAKTMKKKRTAKSKSPADMRAACLVFFTLTNINVYSTDMSVKLEKKKKKKEKLLRRF